MADHGAHQQRLVDKLRTYASHWHMQPTVWIVESELSAARLRDDLKACVSNTDKLFVGRLADAAWTSLAPKAKAKAPVSSADDAAPPGS